MADAAVQGVSHGNLTVDSLWIDSEGAVKISDFMLHQNIVASSANKDRLNHILDMRFLSTAVLNGGNIDEQGDLFSFGVCLYQIFTGTTPNNSQVLDELLAERSLSPFDDGLLKQQGIAENLILVVMGLLNGEFTCFKEVRDHLKQKYFKDETPRKEKGRTTVLIKKKKSVGKLRSKKSVKINFKK